MAVSFETFIDNLIIDNLKRELLPADWIKFVGLNYDGDIQIGDEYMRFILSRDCIHDDLYIPLARTAVDCLIEMRKKIDAAQERMRKRWQSAYTSVA